MQGENCSADLLMVLNQMQEDDNDAINKHAEALVVKFKIEKVKKVHKQAISKPGRKGLYYTYVYNLDGTRIKKSAVTEDKLYFKLYHYYFEENGRTLNNLFEEWLGKRTQEGVSDRTLERNQQHFNKYYVEDPISNMSIDKITPNELETFYYRCIKDFGMTVKELGNMKFVAKDILKMARRRGYTNNDPFRDVEIKTTGCKPTKKKSDRSRVYLPEEKKALFVELNKEIEAYPEVTDMYAIFILFKLGLRIGELVALKWSDIDRANNEILIERMETRRKNKSTGKMESTVADHTKGKSSYGNRILGLSDYELDIFDKVKEVNDKFGFEEKEYVFCDEQGRTRIRAIDNRIRKLCKRAGIEAKSAHDIRRTVASEMYKNNIKVEIIRDYLGHSDIKTTYGYILDNNDKETTAQKIICALNGNNGCKLK